MKTWIMIVLFASTLLGGCAAGDKKSVELLDIAMFEEKQNNFEHAAKLYDEILKKHPESQAAKKASERLAVLIQRKP